jgi:hypothetical protein
MLSLFLRPNVDEVPVLLEQYVTTIPEAPRKLALILSQEARMLSRLDRYERRALSRRKFAIRAFDSAKRRRAQTGM